MGNRPPLSDLSWGPNFLTPRSFAVSTITSNWFFSEAAWTTNWPNSSEAGTAPSILAVPGTYTTVTAAAAVAEYGDVIAVAEGTYTENVTLPVGVTLRSADCKSVVIDGKVICEGQNTLRHLTINGLNPDGCIVAQGDIWCEQLTILAVADSAAIVTTSGVQNMVFRRCRFYNPNNDQSILVHETGGDYFEMSSCIVDWRNTVETTLDVTVGTIVLTNNTIVNLGSEHGGLFLTAASNLLIGQNILHATTSDAYISGVGSDGVAMATNNYFIGTFSEDTGQDVNNTSLASLDTLDLVSFPEELAPRNESVARFSTAGLEGPLLDYAGHPFATNRSVGAFQWQADASALYRPRYDVDLVGAASLGLSHNNLTTITSTAAAAERTYSSHDEVACHVNLVVGDVFHPSRGRFYVTHDGYYRLTLDEGTFDLTLAGDTASVLGAYDMDAQTDTG